eukprot:676762-Prymnesium_polylepis.2
MNWPVDAVSWIAFDTPEAAVCADARLCVVIVAVTVIDPAATNRTTSAAVILPPLAAARSILATTVTVNTCWEPGNRGCGEGGDGA